MAKSLAEAAKEILDASRNSVAEPMHVLPDTGSGLDKRNDLGGSSWEDVEGGDVGAKAAAALGQATPPGVVPDADTKEPMHVEKKTKDVVDSGTNKTDIAAATDYSGNKEKDLAKEEDEANKARWDEIKAIMTAVGGVKEDMDALFGSETLSEEFKSKATTIFEAAVARRALTVAEEIERQVLEAAEEAVSEVREELAEQIDTYLNDMVPEWIQENEVAIESGLRAEIFESFIHGMKNLFAEHYVDVPTEQVDLVSAQEDEIATLTSQMNDVLNRNAELTKKIAESEKKEILNKVCEGLTATQAEKVKTLAEGVEFVTADDYLKKVNVLKEGYASSPKVKDSKTNMVALTESADGAVPQQPTAPAQTTVLHRIH